jgi:DNA gyrase subunit A
MKDDVAEVIVDEDGNVIESAIERVKPDLEVLEDEGTEEEEEDDSDEPADDEDDSEEEESEE